MPRIHLTTTDGATLEFDISATPSNIGRAEDNNFVVPDGSVSSRHGKIYAEGAAIRLVDNDSTNGTFIRGERVEEGTVNPGERFRLGTVEGIVVAPESASPAAPAAEWNASSGGGAAISGLGATPCPANRRVGFGPKVKKGSPVAASFMGIAILSLAICAVAIFMILKMGA